MTAPDIAAILAKHWPFDGPHDRDRTRAAGDMAVALLRYLAGSTDPVHARATLQTPEDVHHLVSVLHAANSYLPQLHDQLQQAVGDMAAAGVLRDGRVPDEPPMGRELADEVVSALSEVLPAVRFLSARLAGVLAHSAHLGSVATRTEDQFTYSANGGGSR